MDQLKSELRGNRGARRKHSFRILERVKRLCFAEPNPSDRHLGKLKNTRTTCSTCPACSPEYKDSVKYKQANEVMACNMAEAALPPANDI
jgi:hypothetical protein